MTTWNPSPSAAATALPSSAFVGARAKIDLVQADV